MQTGDIIKRTRYIIDLFAGNTDNIKTGLTSTIDQDITITTGRFGDDRNALVRQTLELRDKVFDLIPFKLKDIKL